MCLSRVHPQANATAAMKLVAECLPWGQGSELRYLTHNHTSVIGMREVVRDLGVTVSCVDPPLAGIRMEEGADPGGEWPWGWDLVHWAL